MTQEITVDVNKVLEITRNRLATTVNENVLLEAFVQQQSEEIAALKSQLEEKENSDG